MVTDEKLSNLQLELLKMFKFNISESQLNEIRDLLVVYFSKNADDEISKLWEEKDWSDQTISKWLEEHNRTPYKNNL